MEPDRVTLQCGNCKCCIQFKHEGKSKLKFVCGRKQSENYGYFVKVFDYCEWWDGNLKKLYPPKRK